MKKWFKIILLTSCFIATAVQAETTFNSKETEDNYQTVNAEEPQAPKPAKRAKTAYVSHEAPLVQTPPPQNYPNSVSVGTPSYYYYYVPGGYAYPQVYPVAPQTGTFFYQNNVRTGPSFWNQTQIPGQVPPPNSPSYPSGGILYLP